MDEKKLKKSGRICQKCGDEIGGKAYYLVKLDCIYDGKTTSACKNVVMCSDCHNNLKTWLNISE
jgi:hypothetical protein